MNWHPKLLQGISIYTPELFQYRHDNPSPTYWPDWRIEREIEEPEYGEPELNNE